MSLDVSLTVDGVEVYEANITHNLNKMADAAAVYHPVWRPPYEAKAKDILPLVGAGLERLKKYPEAYKTLNPSNGWGSYDVLVEWLENYVAALESYPEATVEAWT